MDIESAPAALALTDYLLAFLAGGNAVAVAFENLLGNPADDGRFVLSPVELLQKLRFKLVDVTHRSL